MNKVFKNCYKNLKVLITGHTGFKGSWLTAWLSYLGADVVGYSLEPPTEPNMFDKIGLETKINHIIGDIRDYKHLKRSLKNISLKWFSIWLPSHWSDYPMMNLN